MFFVFPGIKIDGCLTKNSVFSGSRAICYPQIYSFQKVIFTKSHCSAAAKIIRKPQNFTFLIFWSFLNNLDEIRMLGVFLILWFLKNLALWSWKSGKFQGPVLATRWLISWGGRFLSSIFWSESLPRLEKYDQDFEYF